MGPAGQEGSASRASTSPSATPSAPSSPSRWIPSSTPGRSRASCRRACSRPSSAGARTRSGCRKNGYKHKTGCQAAIYLTQPGANTRVRSWTPTAKAQYGFLVTHNESISIADYFTLRNGRKVSLPADLPLRLSPLQRRGAVAARDVRPGGQAPGQHPHPRRARDRRRHRRARRAALRPQEERLLVRLAALDRRDPRRSRPIRTPPACR